MKNITYKTHPIQSIWIAIPSIFHLIGVMFVLLVTLLVLSFPQTSKLEFLIIYACLYFFLFLPTQGLLVLMQPLNLIIRSLTRKNIEYEFEEEQLIFRHGIISKSERTLRYAVIQNVILTRSLLDYLFKTSTVQIDNASSNFAFPGHSSTGSTGLMGNSVTIPCLNYVQALELREMIMTKLILYSHITSQQGL